MRENGINGEGLHFLKKGEETHKYVKKKKPPKNLWWKITCWKLGKCTTAFFLRFWQPGLKFQYL